MSETATIPQGEADAGTPEPEYKPTHVLSSDPDPEPAPVESTPDKPADKPDAEPPAEPAPKPEKTAEEKARERDNRRYAQAQAARYAEKARADQLEARLRELENPAQQQQPPGIVRQEDLPRMYEEMRAKERTQERVDTFHQAGQAAYPDWAERCQNLMQMGADENFSVLLVETPDGAKVAGALADDPDALERISGLKTERARAIALGHYAASLQAKPAAVPAVSVSRAPSPIQPPSIGRARGDPDPNGSFEEYQRWSEKQRWDRR